MEFLFFDLFGLINNADVSFLNILLEMGCVRKKWSGGQLDHMGLKINNWFPTAHSL